MIILFDLDDTLLENPMEKFLPAYLKSLGNSLSEYIPPKELPALIFRGTDLMVDNIDPTKTLEECFDHYFYQKIGASKELLAEKINFFYQHEFPKLSPLTGEISHAATLIQELIKENHKIIIATNPLFPRIAIEHRINWANLGIDLSKFLYITNFEESHFTKPRPEFYAEVLGKIGWPDNQMVMIGNDWEMDIIPAEVLGIPTFYLGNPPDHNGVIFHPKSSSGTIDQVIEWISKLTQNPFTIDLKTTIKALKAFLLATVANIDSLRRSYRSYDFYSKRPQPSEWSIVEIISHVADVDSEVNIPRLRLIKNDSDPFIEAALTDEWAEERKYIQNNPFTEMDRFIQNRLILIDLINEFDDELWNKKNNHAIFGPTPTYELIKFIAQHDHIHLNQLFKTIEQIQS